MTLHTGEILDGKYRVIRELGSGAMGAVYEAENLRIRRRVAIKVLLPAVAERTDTVQRFEREAQAAGRIGSEHIVEVLDLGTMPDGGFYLVMEYLEGQTLGERIKSCGRIGPHELVPIVQQLLSGLEKAHEASIIHRDLKPDNVFLVREHAGQKDFVKILDFGVSKFNPLNNDEGVSMTRTGTVMGTPFYMAPEQAKGARDIDNRSDIYSVGVILYQAVTGQVPFNAGTFNELIFKIVLETPPPPETYVPDLDPSFSRIIRRSMARERNERYGDAAALRDALSVWLHTGRDDMSSVVTPPPSVATNTDWHGGGGTVLHNPENAGAQTRLVEPDGADTRVTEPRGAASAPPIPVRHPAAPHPAAPQPQLAAGTPAPQPQLAAGTPAPHGPPPSGLDTNNEAWAPYSPPKKQPVLAYIAGAVATIAVGGAAAVLLLSPSKASPDRSVLTEVTSSSDEATIDDIDDIDDEASSVSSAEPNDLEPVAEAPPPPPVQSASPPEPPSAHSQPKQPTGATPSTAAPPQPNKPPAPPPPKPAQGKGKTGGRQIKTEL